MEAEERQAIMDYLAGFIMPRRLAKMKKVLAQRTRHLTVVLEDIYQSQNASAVLRSCECFGVHDVHVIESRYQFDVNPEVVMGASKWLNIKRYSEYENNTRECLTRLKDDGYSIIATSPHKKEFTPDTLPLDRKTALLFGTEHEGLTEDASTMADGYMRIPMVGFTESFNISVSAAISMYHLTNRLRSSADIPWQLTAEEYQSLCFEWFCKSVRNSETLVRIFRDQQINK